MGVAFSQRTLMILRGGIAASFFLPLLYTKAVLFPGHFEKWTSFFFVIDALAVIFLVVALRTRSLPLPRGIFFAGFLVYVAGRIIFGFLGVDPHQSFFGSAIRMTGTVHWILFFIFFVLLVSATPLRAPQWIFRISACVLFIASLSALIIGSNPTLDPDAFGRAGRLSGLFGSPTYLASYLLPGFFALIGGIAHEKQRILKGALATVAALVLWASVGTGIRGAALGGMVGLVVGGITWALLRARPRLRVVVWSAVACALAGVLVYATPQASRVPLLRAFPQFSYSTLAEQTLKSRFILWGTAVEAIRAHPLLGWGPENFVYAFDQHYAPELLHFSFQETWAERPHNAFLEALVSEGIFGGIFYVILYGSLATAAIVAARRTLIPPLHAASVVGLVVAHVVESSFTFELPGALFWVVVAGAVVTSTYGMRGRPLATLGRVAMVLCIGALGVYAWVGIIRPVYASVRAAELQDALIAKEFTALPGQLRGALASHPHAFDIRVSLADDIFRYTGQGVLPPEVAEQATDAVLQSLDDTIRRSPHSFGAAIRRAQFTMRKFESIKSGEWAATVEDALAYARRISPNRQVIVTTEIEFALIRGDVTQARLLAQNLIASDPSLHIGYWLLGITYGIEDPESEHAAFHIVRAVRLGFAPRRRPDIELVAQVLEKTESWDLLVNVFTDLIGIEQWNPEWFFRRGIAYVRMGSITEARGDLLHAIDLDPAYREGAEALLRQLIPR